jgi:hypothetical protein
MVYLMVSAHFTAPVNQLQEVQYCDYCHLIAFCRGYKLR